MSSPTEVNSPRLPAAQNPLTESAPRRRALLHLGILLLLALGATLLALAPALFPPPLDAALGLFFIFFLPGYLGAKILFPAQRELSLTRLPVFFVFALAVWALPATALQFLGANWSAFRIVFVVILWALTLLVVWRVQRGGEGAIRGERIWKADKRMLRWHTAPAAQPLIRFLSAGRTELALALLCIVAAVLVARGPRNADDWMYLQIAQQFIASEPFQILAASEARYSVRYAFHVWIFLQAYMAEWLDADVVTLVRDWLPVLVTPLALISFYAWGRTFFGRANAALLAVLIQLAIAVTFANGDGWGRGFFARSAQDKYLVSLVVVPVALAFAWNFLREGKFTLWFAYGGALVAGLWVHPVSLFFVVIALAGFALFNLISRVSFPRRRWLWLTVASLPALLSPIVIRATTLPSVFTIDTAEVEAYLRLSPERLLFQPPFYIADPRLLGNPIILFSLVVLVLFAPRLRHEPRVQFLWGSTLVPLALLFNPWTARLLGELLTPWQLWRLTWMVPAAFILTEGVMWVRSRSIDWKSTAEHRPAGKKHSERGEQGNASVGANSVSLSSRRAVLVGGVLLLAAVAAVEVSNLRLERSLDTFRQDHTFPLYVEDILRTVQRTLNTRANVLLPREITRYAPAYTPYAVVLSDSAQKPEDTRGQQIDRFYDPAADPKFLEGFLKFWEIEYAAVPNDSLQDKFLQAHPRATFLYKNTRLTLYRVAR